MGLNFKDTFNVISLETESFLNLPLATQLALISAVKTRLEWIERKGYLSTVDLTTYPIVSDFLPVFLNGDQGVASLDFINGSKSKECFKWIYNFILLNLYYLTILTLQTLSFEELESDSDLVTDFHVKERELFSKIDTSIKHHMRKQGLSLIQNVYTGFDTEFKAVDIAQNSLVSAQICVSSRLNLKIPKINRYKISNLDVEKNTLHSEYKSSAIFNYSKVENSIQNCLQKIKAIKFGNYDEVMHIYNECFKNLKGVKYYEGEEFNLFAFPRSQIQPYILLQTKVSLKELIKITTSLSKPTLDNQIKSVINLIKDISSKGLTTQKGQDDLIEQIYKNYEGYTEITDQLKFSDKQLPYRVEDVVLSSKPDKRLVRIFLPKILSQGNKISVTITKNHYFIAHLTQADLSMLTDFDLIKEELSIVNGSFVTLRDPLKYCGQNIHIRDTMLLAPGPGKSLAKIGKLYGEGYNKLTISPDNLKDMQSFLDNDRELFIEYALRDALISLVHALWMEEFNFSLGALGIPLTLSSLGRRYVKQIWRDTNYKGYQISQAYPLGDVSATITPKGLNAVKSIGFVLPYYIANYKGGRNECFMYGIDRKTIWYDFDLTNAYTTVMAMAGHPDYKQYRRINEFDLNQMSNEEILYSYLIIQADFEFPAGVKYPSIPCFVDESSTIFPLKGSCVITGSEYLLAKSQSCKFNLKEIHLTPFLVEEFKSLKPFETILKLVQEKRREYAKGTINNLMYKEIGNSIYGSVVRGISNKKKFDIKTQSTQRLLGDDLSNPLIASWTTAFVRSIIGECLDGIHKLGGLVVSVTTDGFITNLIDIESRIQSNYLLSEFKKIRKVLSEDDTGLELKHSGKGLLAWTTRGQLGFESKILATTGFQHYYSLTNMVKALTETFHSSSKKIEFIQTRLRSAKDIYKKGGHVTMVYKDQQFRMHFDNKRVIEVFEDQIEADLIQESLLDSKPLLDINHGENLRFISKLTKEKQYSRFSNLTNLNRYKNNEDLVVTNFIKGLLSEPPMFKLHRNGLESYKAIVEYIKEFNPARKISPQSIALLKNRSIKWKSVPKDTSSEEFVKYIKIKFIDFDEESFFRER
jgi:hypothetical protein